MRILWQPDGPEIDDGHPHFIGTALSFIPAVASIAGGISSMANGSGAAPSGPAPTGYQPAYQGQADSDVWNSILNPLASYGNPLASTLPGPTQAALAHLLSNPYATAYTGGGAAAGAASGGVANSLANLGSTLYGEAATPQALMTQLLGAGGGALPAAQDLLGYSYGAVPSGLSLLGTASALNPAVSSILATGFDPQSALYDRTQNQLLQQLNAVNAQNGLAGTPAGAGLAGQGLSNFNIDWQNAQLGRQQQAIEGANQGISGLGNAIGGYGAALAPLGRAIGSYGSAIGAGTDALQGYNAGVSGSGRAAAGAGDLMSSYLSTLAGGWAPAYSAYQSVYGNELGSLGSAGNLLSAPMTYYTQMMGPYASYLGLGQGATENALAGWKAQAGNAQNVGNAIGGGLNSLSNLFSGNGRGSGGWGSNYTGASSFTGAGLGGI